MINTPTNEQFEILIKHLKDKNWYNPELHTADMLTRFLKARKFDLDKTLKMLLDFQEWYITNNIAEVSSFVFPEQRQVHELYPRYYHKTDKVGRPVYIEQLNSLDVNKLFKITTQERLLKKYVREYEKLLNYRFKACSVKSGHHIDQGTSIIDLKGVPLSQFNQVRKVLSSVSSIASNYYPETMGKMFIINAPTLFTAIWTIIKGMLDEATVAKIKVLGSSYQSELLDVIPAENLQVQFGGKCTLPAGDYGPWNDGTAAGYPIAFFEDMDARDLAAPQH
jgi:hypothetical protein